MSLYVEVEASHQGCGVAEAVAGMRVPWEGWACSQRLGLRGSGSVCACSGKRRQRHAVDNNHARGKTDRTKQIMGTAALLGMLWRQATLEQARGCGDSGDCGDNNHARGKTDRTKQILGTAALLRMLWRQATLDQARGCGDSGDCGGGGGGGGSGGASSGGSGGKAACGGGSSSAMTSEAACGTTPGRGCQCSMQIECL